MKSQILYTFLFFVVALISTCETIGDDDHTHHGPGCDPVVTSSATPTIPTPSPYIPVSTTTRPPSTPPTSSFDFTRGGCRPVLMVYFRSQVDPGNIGYLGSQLKASLATFYKEKFGMEGINYAIPFVNSQLPPPQPNPADIRTATNLINRIANNCTDTAILVGAYSAGTSLAAKMIEGLTSQVKDRLKAVVLFGYNKNQQNQGKVPGFPDEKLKVICNEGDLVCNGTLIITPHHLTYQQRLGEAVEFIKDRVVLPVN